MTGLMRLISPRIGLIDKPGARKVHLIPTPLGGGIGIWCGVVLPLVAAQILIFLWGKSPPEWLPLELAQHLAGATYRARELWAIIAAATVLSVTGLVDDFRPLSWKFRMGLQFGVSILVVLMGVRATVFVNSPLIGGIVSVIWFVVLVNSFNFLDNMDGLSGGIALIVSTIFAAMMLTKLPGDPHWFVGGFFLDRGWVTDRLSVPATGHPANFHGGFGKLFPRIHHRMHDAAGYVLFSSNRSQQARDPRTAVRFGGATV